MLETSTRIERLDIRRVDELHAIEIRGYPFPWSAKIMQDSFRAGTACWALLDAQDSVLAYAFFSIAAGEAQLLNLCVDPEHHGRGLGRRLMQHLLHTAREQFCTILLLEVRRSNAIARRLYESLGFNTLGVRKGYYPNGPGATEDALVMGFEIV